MNKNYRNSIEKWQGIKEKIELMHPNTTNSELREFWNTEVWKPCGFCHEFGVNESKENCDNCPLDKKHCNQYSIICAFYKNTMYKIHKAIREKKLTRAINLIDYFIRCMRRYKSKFKQETK